MKLKFGSQMSVDLKLKVCLKVTKARGNFGCPAVMELILMRISWWRSQVSTLKYQV